MPELFIRKPIMTTLVMVVVIAFGVGAYLSLPVSSLPSVDYPVMQISASYPGASPQTMASTVATPLESECMQINGLQSIISDNKPGSTTITLTFDLGKKVDLVAPDVQAAISRAQNNLPSDLPSPPSYNKDNPSEKPIMYLMVMSQTLTPGELYDYANRFMAKRINIINGVSKVQIYGAKTAVRIQADPEKIAAYQLTLEDLSQAIDNGTVSIPGGSLNGEFRTFSIEPQGQLREAEQYKRLIVAYRDQAPVFMEDIATCAQSLDDDLVDVRYGMPVKSDEVHEMSICMAISKQSGANTVALARNVRKTLEDIRKEIPESVEVDIMYDGAKPIQESINDVETTIIVAIALVVMIIFLFLGRLRETIIPSIVIPIALVATFIIMAACGFSLDTLSLMALVLSVGFLVDDAIVVLENTVRHVETGLKPIPAAIKSMGELTGTVISTSVALVIVFVPLVFMSGVVGRNFREFALTAIFAITVSTLLALSLTPMMCSRMLKATKGHKTRVQKVVDRIIGGMTNHYGGMLKFVLRNKVISVMIWLACIIGIAFLFSALPKTFMPPGDSGMIFGAMMMPQGASSKEMKAYQDKVQALLMKNPHAKNVTTITGAQTGADQSTGYVIVSLKDRKERPSIDQVNKELTAQLMALPDGMVFMDPIPVMKLSSGGESTATGSKYSYLLRGNDRDTLYAMADKLKNKMMTLQGFQGVQSSVKLNMPQLNININRDRASSLGLTAGAIERALSLAFAQGRVTTFTTDNDQYDVILELDKACQDRPDNLHTIYLRSSITGKLVPIGSVADWEEVVGPQNVPHSQQMDAATLSFNLDPSVPLGDATKALNAAAAEILPPDITGTLQGEAQEFQEAIKSLVVLMGVAVFLMYIVLGILYESYIHPFTVLTTLPVGAFGGLLTLLIFNSELSLYAYIGMFTLLGIIAKNGIMMVDFAKQHLEENPGAGGFDAIYNACIIRFRPILMTGMSTIFGTMPIALGIGADAESRIPLGLVIVGGMIFAQVITLFVTPGIFLYMQWIQEHVLDRGSRKELLDDSAAVA
jgi:HAE1 family hydrophobic/amphiphilic exporter-1